MARMSEHGEKVTKRPLRPRIIWTIVRASGLLPVTLSFILMFGVFSLVVAAVEPDIPTVFDAAWFLYTVIITIGLGDYTCVTAIGRIATIALSLYSVFFLALVTGTVVNYCAERMKLESNESVAAFIDKLERLPELSDDELAELSEQIKRMR